MDNRVSKDISRTIASYASRYYQYFELEGKPIPDFNFVDINGHKYNKATCQGKFLVLNCWFINCTSCVAEFPKLNHIVNTYKNRKDILFVSLALDSTDQIKNFLKKNKFEYEVVPNMKEYLLDTLKVFVYPTHLIINKNGNIINMTDDYHQMEIMLKKVALE